MNYFLAFDGLLLGSHPRSYISCFLVNTGQKRNSLCVAISSVEQQYRKTLLLGARFVGECLGFPRFLVGAKPLESLQQRFGYQGVVEGFPKIFMPHSLAIEVQDVGG